MATPPQPTPEQVRQIQMQLAAEAQRRGMTPQQLQQFHRQQLEAEAAKQNLTPEEYINKVRRDAFEQHQRQQAQQQQQQSQQQGQQGGQPGQQRVEQQIPLTGGVEAKPEAIAVAKFLRAQNLKTRTCILDGQRRDMFKVKRAIRALLSLTYQKARSKNALLPEVTNEAQAKGAIQLLPLSVLALRVSKVDPHEGHDHAKPKKEKRIKGLWTVKVERQQEFEPMMHYVWLYEGPQWKTKLYAGLAVAAIFAVVLFPLWPIVMRQGVWYLSWGCLCLLGLFFAMAIFRLILFCITYFTTPPGLWLFPNLFEDVGFFDSFKPVWGWQETKKGKKKSKKAVGSGGGGDGKDASTKANGSAESENARLGVNGAATGAEVVPISKGVATKRHEAPRVEEVEDE